MSDKPAATPPRVGLFVTCLVDLARPCVGFAAEMVYQQMRRPVHDPPPQRHAAVAIAADDPLQGRLPVGAVGRQPAQKPAKRAPPEPAFHFQPSSAL